MFKIRAANGIRSAFLLYVMKSPEEESLSWEVDPLKSGQSNNSSLVTERDVSSK